jgi:arrestin (S-antigen)-like protein
VSAETAPQIVWTEESHGVEWRVELARADLLPGRLVPGRIQLTARDGFVADALRISVTATEHWKHEQTSTDAQGHTTTRVVTSHAEVVREPVDLLAPVSLAAGETREFAFELPVPPLGPASLDADVAGLEWLFEAKLDVPGGFDSRLERAVLVHQPTALLRAGAVPVEEFALYGSADVAADGITGTIELEPMPLACGQPFRGRVVLQVPSALKLQEVRAEVQVRVEATVSGGRSETITAWSSVLVPEGVLEGDRTIEVEGVLDTRPLPTIELPHGRTAATFHVILARAWAPDTHLVRDVAIATTTEL